MFFGQLHVRMTWRVEIQKVHLDLGLEQVVAQKEGDSQGNGKHWPAMTEEKADISFHPLARQHDSAALLLGLCPYIRTLDGKSRRTYYCFPANAPTPSPFASPPQLHTNILPGRPQVLPDRYHQRQHTQREQVGVIEIIEHCCRSKDEEQNERHDFVGQREARFQQRHHARNERQRPHHVEEQQDGEQDCHL